MVSVLHQTYGLQLWDQVEWLGSPVAAAGLGVLLLAEVITDMVPCIDNCLHGVMTFVHPFAGVLAGVAADSCAGWGGAVPLAFAGSVTALLTHASKAGVRATSTAGSAGCCNPFISLAETVLTFIVVVAAVLFAVAAIVAAGVTVALVAYGAWKFAKKLRKRNAAPAADGVPLTPKGLHGKTRDACTEP